jgi:L-alanine-DL-glutamate epimerase-like enolase superfamily enzyme
VRESVGPGVQLYVDANCSLDGYHALELARRLEPYDVALFEEPVTQNDVRVMADLRRKTRIPLGAGQNEGLAFRFRDLVLADAVDLLQPNVVISGGFTQVARIAGMAAAFNVPVANGGAWTHHNMHLHAGLVNGTLVEYHYVALLVCEQLFDGLAVPQDGWLELGEAPGLGFTPRADAIRELARRPTSRGKGKA